MKACSRRSGFTLVELITVIIIAGIMLGVTANAIGRLGNSTRLQQASTAVAANVQQAFSLASKRRSPVRISIDTANKVFRVRDRTTPTNIYLQQYYNNTSDLSVSRFQASDTSLVIFPNGLASGPLTITVHTPTDRRRVSVTRAGQIRITTP